MTSGRSWEKNPEELFSPIELAQMHRWTPEELHRRASRLDEDADEFERHPDAPTKRTVFKPHSFEIDHEVEEPPSPEIVEQRKTWAQMNRTMAGYLRGRAVLTHMGNLQSKQFDFKQK